MTSFPVNGDVDDGLRAVEALANWSTGIADSDIPNPVWDVARNCLVDTVGVTIAGSCSTVAEIARETARKVAAPGYAEVIGASVRLAAAGAAFANGTAAHAFDFDDNCYAGFVHGSAVIVPAALAVAQASAASGKSLLRSIVVAAEVEYALGAAATTTIYERGWWTTGVFGTVGAAVAAASLTELDPRETRNALGIAIAGAGAAKSCFGTDAKPLLCGRSAEVGIVAAMLAQAGATGPADAIEHRAGLSALFTSGRFEPEHLSSLGRDWRLLAPGIDVKRIPVCLSSHAAVDVSLALVAEHRLPIEHIASITCDVPPIVIANLVHNIPTTRQEAQFSMPYAVAASLAFGSLKLEHLDPAWFGQGDIASLMRKVTMFTGDKWTSELRSAAPEGAYVRITLDDGRSFEGFRAFPRGAASDPLNTGAIDQKFLDCAGPVLGEATAMTLLGQLRDIDDLDDVRRLPLGLAT